MQRGRLITAAVVALFAQASAVGRQQAQEAPRNGTSTRLLSVTSLQKASGLARTRAFSSRSNHSSSRPMERWNG